jgi:hypothetical protein
MRNCSNTTSNDNVAAKALRAVFGSKNLKAVAVRGSGAVRPADIGRSSSLGQRWHAFHKPNPIVRRKCTAWTEKDSRRGGWLRGSLVAATAATTLLPPDDGLKSAFRDVAYKDGRKVRWNFATALRRCS